MRGEAEAGTKVLNASSEDAVLGLFDGGYNSVAACILHAGAARTAFLRKLPASQWTLAKRDRDIASMEIIALTSLPPQGREDAADILVRALSHCPSAWKDLPSTRAEVETFLGDSDRVAWAGVAEGRVIGWIGAIRQSAFAWELHPLVVDPAHQRRGCGTRLVAALEAAARDSGVVTIWLGADDDFGGTNLFGRDLYPDVLDQLSRLGPSGTGHAHTFYRRLGYSVVGVLPDINGVGRHDILMAKRLDSPPV